MPQATSGYLFDHVCRDVREDDLAAFEHLQQGGTYLDIPQELRRYGDDSFTDKYKRLEWEKPSRTITAHIARDGYWYIHPDQQRTLSVREAARIQTFPDWYRFAGFPSNRFVQIGNAVPPLLGRALGAAMRAVDRGEGRASTIPEAAHALQDSARDWRPLEDWVILVQEVVFRGRAGDQRLDRFLERLPDAREAADLGDARTSHDRRASVLARAFLDAGTRLPDQPGAVRAFADCSSATARLIVSLAHGGEPPRSAATIRVAERVSGVRRAGSLNGVSHVVLARLASFGTNPAANQLLLDIGRNVCLPESPRCSVCPLAAACDFALADGHGSSVQTNARQLGVTV